MNRLLRLLRDFRLPAIVLACVGCGSSPRKPPCDPTTAATLAAQCAAKVQSECVSKGIAEEDCQPLKDCDAAADKRQSECLQ